MESINPEITQKGKSAHRKSRYFYEKHQCITALNMDIFLEIAPIRKLNMEDKMSTGAQQGEMIEIAIKTWQGLRQL